jgi:hypothetical protein
VAAKGEKQAKGEHPDHIVVIKYVPAVGDSKRAIDEYYSEIFCGGRLDHQHLQRVRGKAPLVKPGKFLFFDVLSNYA